MPINGQIKEKEVQVIGENGEKLGVLSRQAALDAADNHNLDLVLVSPEGNPPVAKLMDYSRFRFEQQKKLKEMKKNVYGFEVDSGKSDIVTGKVSINFAWSGDAVYSLDVAEEENEVYLNYQVPEEGSNVWFDGWVMPKGANKELAQSFVNYLCDPKIAVRNMNYIGYTSSIVGDEIIDMIDDWYGAESEETAVEMDLTYFFGDTVEKNEEGKVLLSVDEHYIGRQFTAQYPDFETITRCGVMEDFGVKNEAVLAMWANFKANELSPLTWAFVIILGVLAISWMTYSGIRQRNRRLHIRH